MVIRWQCPQAWLPDYMISPDVHVSTCTTIQQSGIQIFPVTVVFGSPINNHGTFKLSILQKYCFIKTSQHFCLIFSDLRDQKLFHCFCFSQQNFCCKNLSFSRFQRKDTFLDGGTVLKKPFWGVSIKLFSLFILDLCNQNLCRYFFRFDLCAVQFLCCQSF